MSAERALSIAILGTRGVPARYGGFETFAEQLSRRLVERGHRVLVYGRSRYAVATSETGHGVERVVLPALYSKHLETASHTLLSALHCMSLKPDVALVCNTANACFLPLLHAAGIPTVLNVDGLEWQRRKWGAFGRTVHQLSEHLAAAWAGTLIADAAFIGRYYRQRHQVSAVGIPYGGDLPSPRSTSFLAELGLQPGGYDLCVCRFEPENRPLTVLRAHRQLAERLPLVMVGGAPYAHAYRQAMHQAAATDVLFTGFRFGDQYRQLLFHARALLYAGEVGGTHPVLLEAMAAGRLILYNDTAENRETVGEAGLPFGPGDEESLRTAWARMHRHPEWIDLYGDRARQRAEKYYRWQTVTEAYEAVFRQAATEHPA